jgi:hypothetical protein
MKVRSRPLASLDQSLESVRPAFWGRFRAAGSGMACRKERQIVHSARVSHGFLPGLSPFKKTDWVQRVTGSSRAARGSVMLATHRGLTRKVELHS